MRIAAIADLHGLLPDTPHDCDVLLVAGDVTPFRDHTEPFQAAWLRSAFSEWLRTRGVPVIGVAGNHDLIAEVDPELMRDLPWTYLADETVEFEGLRVHGSPWSTRFFDWAFMGDEPELEEKWNLIPDDVDVLMTHGPPRGFGDQTRRGPTVGSITLTRHLERLTQLKLHVFGHIHEAPGMWEYNGAKLANVTHVDLQYRPAFHARVFEI